jgi:hypothetical protein
MEDMEDIGDFPAKPSSPTDHLAIWRNPVRPSISSNPPFSQEDLKTKKSEKKRRTNKIDCLFLDFSNSIKNQH